MDSNNQDYDPIEGEKINESKKASFMKEAKEKKIVPYIKEKNPRIAGVNFCKSLNHLISYNYITDVLECSDFTVNVDYNKTLYENLELVWEKFIQLKKKDNNSIVLCYEKEDMIE